jgi:FAD/FMN-containing dehydrogenase
MTTRRSVIKLGAAAAGAALLPRMAKAQQRAEARIVLNDASRLNPTPVMRHWLVGDDPEAAMIERLRRELKEAASERRPFAVGGARHSMGGQSLARNGSAATFATRLCELDTAAKTYRTHSGSRWAYLIQTLDRAGFSPAVMQSNNDFATGGTLSVNAHGWPVPFGPFGATVRSFRLMLADGSIVTCSPTENAELYGLVQGGYGLFGVILDMVVDMVPNALLKPTNELMPASEFGPRFVAAIDRDPSIQMAYGRLSVARRDFVRQALMITYRPVPNPPRTLPAASAGGLMSSVSREIFRAQIGSDTGKRARWAAETVGNPAISSGIATRSTLMNEPVANLAGRDAFRTDILHEYFVAPERFDEFLAACRDTILRSRQDLLNVTLRYVKADPVSTLSYAPGPRIAAVMLFSQAVTAEAEADMLMMTEALIERVIAIGGSFYLPYRLHARRDQVERAYPNLARFVAKKREIDPGLLFRNTMWDAYFA